METKNEMHLISADNHKVWLSNIVPLKILCMWQEHYSKRTHDKSSNIDIPIIVGFFLKYSTYQHCFCLKKKSYFSTTGPP